MDDFTGHVIRGYELRERVGTGGFGAVYRAYQPVVGREVAIKVILPQFANHPDFIRRFEMEAQLVARLEHLHIVPLYDFWREPDRAYLIMRWLGDNLRHSLQAGAWSPARVTRLLDQVASALAAAHRHGVIHRDIKPDNILLDSDGNAYLADFGIAKDLSAALTTEGENFLGSPYYVTPEQIRGEAVTPQTDIYSLGVVLYEVLAGSKPFGDASPTTLIFKHLNDPLPPLHEKQPTLPVALDAVIQKATAKKPEDRFTDVLTLAAMFRRSLDGAGVEDIVPVRSQQPALHGSGILDDTPTIMVGALPAEIENPYKGLRAFQEADSADFFGRDALTHQLIRRLTPDSNKAHLTRFLAVVGPSGSGKSSVVKAGLIPALRRGTLPGSDKWFIVEMMPGSQPIDNLATALTSIAFKPPVGLTDQLRSDVRGLLWSPDRLLGGADGDLLLVIDQFEELFTLVADEQERAFFLELLRAAVMGEGSRVQVIITLRADFTDRPLHYIDFGELMRERMELVLPLSARELEQAIISPAARVGVVVDTDLVTAIVADVRDEPGALPLLQFALSELFEQREGNRLALAAYQKLGGAAGALERSADLVYTSLTPDQQAVAQQIFLRLITLGEGVEDTRRRVRHSELEGLGKAQPILDAFGAQRLLTFDREPVSREPTVEVAHEALLREWKLLRRWLEEARADVRLQRVLMSAAAEWEQSGHDASFLLSGTLLAQYEDWRAGVALTPGEQAFLDASLAERERQAAAEQARQEREQRLERRSRNFLRGLVAVMLLATLGAFGLTGVAVGNANQARTNSTVASARELAAASVNNLNLDPQLSLLLALRAVRTTYDIDGTWTREAEEALHRAVGAPQARQVLRGHDGVLYDVAYSPDGTRVATASVDGTAKVWDVASGEVLLTLQQPDAADASKNDATPESDVSNEVYSVAFSPDGTRLATGTREGMTYVWDANTGELLASLQSSDTPMQITSLAFSPDGTQLAAYGASLFSMEGNSEAVIWNLASDTVDFAVSGTGTVLGGVDLGVIWGDVAFSPDGSLVAASNGPNIELWSVARQEKILTLTGNTRLVTDLEFSPDGTRVASTSADATTNVWEIVTPLDLGAETTRPYLTLSGNNGLAFSPDGARLATVIPDGTTNVWNVDNGALLYSLTGYNSSVRSVAFSPDGQQIATVGTDGAARLWNASPGAELYTLVANEGFGLPEYSPDGTILVTSDSFLIREWDAQSGEERFSFEMPTSSGWVNYNPDGTRVGTASDEARVWDVNTGELLLTLTNHEGPTDGIVFSPDNTLIATAGVEDRTVRLWDAATGAELAVLTAHTGGVHCLEFSPDGRYLVSGGDDRTVIVWDVATRETLFSLPVQGGVVTLISYSPDGRYLAVASDSEAVSVWDMTTQEQTFTLSGHSGSIQGVSYSYDGTMIATGGGTSIKLWDAASGEELLTLYGHTGDVGYVGFSPDGRNLVSSSGTDRSLRVYILPLEDLMATAETRITRALTVDECRRYLHVETCPPDV